MFTIPSKYGTKKVINWNPMTYHDFSFFSSFEKYNIFDTGVEGENVVSGGPRRQGFGEGLCRCHPIFPSIDW